MTRSLEIGDTKQGVEARCCQRGPRRFHSFPSANSVFGEQVTSQAQEPCHAGGKKGDEKRALLNAALFQQGKPSQEPPGVFHLGLTSRNTGLLALEKEIAAIGLAQS